MIRIVLNVFLSLLSVVVLLQKTDVGNTQTSNQIVVVAKAN